MFGTLGMHVQAEKQSMEQQLEALTLQLENMKAINAEAAGHNSTLEKAITLKDNEVAKLQESKHVSVDAHPVYVFGCKPVGFC